MFFASVNRPNGLIRKHRFLQWVHICWLLLVDFDPFYFVLGQ